MGKRIMITAGNVTIPAVLNDTKAARDFERRLPFKVTCHDSGIDYCGTTVNGRYDPAEMSVGWKNGDIMQSGGWFALLYGGEEQSASYGKMMIIGHVEDNDALKMLPETIHLTVTGA